MLPEAIDRKIATATLQAGLIGEIRKLRESGADEQADRLTLAVADLSEDSLWTLVKIIRES